MGICNSAPSKCKVKDLGYSSYSLSLVYGGNGNFETSPSLCAIAHLIKNSMRQMSFQVSPNISKNFSGGILLVI